MFGVGILMAVYQADSPRHFEAALDSLSPFVERLDEIVLVVDGPLPASLEAVIAARRSSHRLNCVYLPESVGLGAALNKGLAVATSPWLMRMDSDDLARPDRFEKLVGALRSSPFVDVLGSYIAEFDEDPQQPVWERRVPLQHEEIVDKLRWRCVINHVSVIFRREVVVAVGGYQGGKAFPEDWWLWVRLANAGCRFRNIPEVLIDVRVGNGFVARRRGWSFIKNDINFFWRTWRSGFIGFGRFVILLSTKLIARVIPSTLLLCLYRFVRTPVRE